MPNAVVTGASRGFGRALATSLVGDGWSVVIDARTAGDLDGAASELRRLPGAGRVVPVAGDVSREEHRRSLAAAARRLGPLDLVVNNAGVLGPSPRPALRGLSLDDLRLVFDVNVVAPLGLIQDLAPLLSEDAIIVNVTSDAAIEAYDGWGAYGMAKAALDQLSAVLAVEAPGWAVYAFDPGDMRTQMHQEAFPGEDISDRPPPDAPVPALRTLLATRPPSGRYRAGAFVDSGTPR